MSLRRGTGICIVFLIIVVIAGAAEPVAPIEKTVVSSTGGGVSVSTEYSIPFRELINNTEYLPEGADSEAGSVVIFTEMSPTQMFTFTLNWLYKNLFYIMSVLFISIVFRHFIIPIIRIISLPVVRDSERTYNPQDYHVPSVPRYVPTHQQQRTDGTDINTSQTDGVCVGEQQSDQQSEGVLESGREKRKNRWKAIDIIEGSEEK